ncbi:glycosyltransferase family 4 protein [Hyalangium gracile]|uniref:glycosyltransferase family 4 protein n=1 Tax=Hyalangium gracile TaxID=394092 RepID=UPI001CCED1FA|nr:glycosyltransferase family 4 protein [Hyalangium gracile]
MRILMLLSSQYVTGPSELCLSDAEALRAQGHEVWFGCDTRREGNYARTIEQAGFTLRRELTLCQVPRAGEVVKDLLALRRLLREVDLVHARFSHDHLLSELARGRTPLVRTVENAKAMTRRAGKDWLLRRANGVIVSCEPYARELSSRGVAPERVHVVPGRVDATRFTPGPSRLRAELGLEHSPTLVIVSRIKPDRRHTWLIDAFAQADLPAEARLLIVGRGEGREAVEAHVQSRGLTARVHFTGYRKGPDLVDAYRAGDAVAWLAEGNDGTCRAVLEAMACGRPVLGAAEGAIAEAIVPEETGLLVPPGDVAALALAIGRVLRNPGLAESWGQAARRRAEQFTPSRRAQALLSVYERACS